MDVRVKFSETEIATIKISKLITMHSLKLMVSNFTRAPIDSITIYVTDKQITENDNIFNLIMQNGNEIIVKYVDAAHSVKDIRDASLFSCVSESYAECNTMKYANGSTLSPNQEYLLNLGFSSYMVTNALQTCDNNLSKALELLLSHPISAIHSKETLKSFTGTSSKIDTKLQSYSDEPQSESIVSKEAKIEQEKIKKEADRLEALEHNIFKDKESYQKVLKIINKINESSRKTNDQEGTVNDQEASDNDSYSSTMQNLSNNLLTKPLTGRRFRGITVLRQVPEPKSSVSQIRVPQTRNPENNVNTHIYSVETPKKNEAIINPAPNAATLDQQLQINPISQQNTLSKPVEKPLVPLQAPQKIALQPQPQKATPPVQIAPTNPQQIVQQNTISKPVEKTPPPKPQQVTLPPKPQQVTLPPKPQQVTPPSQIPQQVTPPPKPQQVTAPSQAAPTNSQRIVQQNLTQVIPPAQQQIILPNFPKEAQPQAAFPNKQNHPEPAKQIPPSDSDSDDVLIIGFKKYGEIGSQQPEQSNNRQYSSQIPNENSLSKDPTQATSKQNKISDYIYSQQPISHSQNYVSKTENLRKKMCVAYSFTPDRWDQINQKVPEKTIVELQDEIVLIQNNPKYAPFLATVDTNREPTQEELEKITKYYKEYKNNYAAIAQKLIKRTPQAVENIIQRYFTSNSYESTQLLKKLANNSTDFNYNSLI